MKSLLQFACCACLALLISGCDQNNTGPLIPGDSGGIRDSSFAIFSLDSDSLYFGEHGRLRERGFGEVKDSITLFVGSHPYSVVAANDSIVEFIVPENAQSGTFRLYRGEKKAEGTVHITIIEQSVKATTEVYKFGPKEGYEQEAVTILGDNLRFRRRDAHLMFGDVEAHIDSFSKNAIFAKVPLGVKSGHVDLYSPTRNFYLGEFKRLEKPASTLFANELHGLTISIRGIVIFDQVFGDSIVQTMFMEMNNTYLFQLPSMKLVAHGDSLTYSGMCQGTSQDTTWVDLRLKPSFDLATVSGTLRWRKGERNLAGEVTSTEIVFDLKDLSYRDESTVISFKSSQVDSRAGISFKKFEIMRTGNGLVVVDKLQTAPDFTDVQPRTNDPAVLIQLIK